MPPPDKIKEHRLKDGTTMQSPADIMRAEAKRRGVSVEELRHHKGKPDK